MKHKPVLTVFVDVTYVSGSLFDSGVRDSSLSFDTHSMEEANIIAASYHPIHRTITRPALGTCVVKSVRIVRS